jgi:[protein-PII] uridylyltransferase
LRRGLENPIDKEELLRQRKFETRELLSRSKVDVAIIDKIWTNFTDEYFLRCRPDEIHSHTLLFADAEHEQHECMVDVLGHAFQGGTAVFIFAPQQQYAFATATAVLDALGLNVADARIIPLKNAWSLSTFVVPRLDQIKRRLTHALTTTDSTRLTVTRRAPRQVRMFSTPTIINFAADEANNRTVMELIAGDRPGLLSEVGQILREYKINIQTAKILTIGERAEDVFFITDDHGNPLHPERYEELERAISTALGQTAGSA